MDSIEEEVMASFRAKMKEMVRAQKNNDSGDESEPDFDVVAYTKELYANHKREEVNKLLQNKLNEVNQREKLSMASFRAEVDTT